MDYAGFWEARRHLGLGSWWRGRRRALLLYVRLEVGYYCVLLVKCGGVWGDGDGTTDFWEGTVIKLACRLWPGR
jgi:hypothetical protein